MDTEIAKIRAATEIPPNDDSDDDINLTQMIEKVEQVIHGGEKPEEVEQTKAQTKKFTEDDQTEKEKGEIIEGKSDSSPHKGMSAAYQA